MCCACDWIERYDLGILETDVFEDESGICGRQDAVVSRVQMEIVACDNQIFGIGSFNDEKSAGAQNPVCLKEEFHKDRKRQMLEKVKCRDNVHAVRSQILQMADCVCLDDVQTPGVAFFHHAGV